MHKYFFSLALSTIAILLSSTFITASTGPLHINNNKFVYSDGTRFIVKGVNIEAYRDYGGCGYITDDGYPQRDAMATALKAYGVNAVRLNYNTNFLSANLSKYLDFMQAFTNKGIFVMPSDFATDNNLTTRAKYYPMMKQIINGARARGIDSYLIMNPFNEPANLTWTDWVTYNKDILNVLRSPDTAANYTGFKGIIMLDTPNWAGETDLSTGMTRYADIVNYDKTLLGGTANVGFSNHYYPNLTYGDGHLDAAIKASSTYALIVGELGRINPGVYDTINNKYVTDSLDLMISQGIPNGHNGVFGWIWVWCDDNNMTTSETNYTTAGVYGQLYINSYWSKLPDNNTTPTNTPPMSNTLSPSPTGTSKLGDTNNDSMVNEADYRVWAANYSMTGNKSGGYTIADFNKDGFVDGIDYSIWVTNYGK
jgi:hypothetical protein